MTDEVSNERTTIKPTKDGSYKVRNLGSFTNSKGEELPRRSTLYLCRCGNSAKKPFCDNSHASNGFSGANEADGSKDKREDYSSGDLTIHDNRGVCAHIGRCSDGLPSVFRLGTEPWIDPDGADAESVTSTVRLCPSGALSYSLEGEEHRDTERPAGIVVSKDGPYVVSGGIELEGAEWGDGASREHYALCRCGKSRNKPFCDGSHWQGFKDDKN